MTKQERIKENLQKNEPFITAFDYFARLFTDGSQKDLAVLIGTKSPRISEYRNGKCPVPDEVIDGLIRFSAKKKMQIYSGYLQGHSDIMLLANVPDEELAEAESRRNNPDYDILQQRLRDSERNLDAQLSQSLPPTSAYSTTDPSSIMNAALAAQMQTIESLKSEKATLLEAHARELKAKDDLIQSLRNQLAAKDQLIAEQKARLIDYHRIIDSRNDISDYPFPIGVADNNQSLKTAKK